MIEQAIAFIKNGKEEEARKLISAVLQEDCTGLIIKKMTRLSQYEALSIYYEALLLMIEKIKSNEFKFIGTTQFISYFKQTCINKAREYGRALEGPKFIVSSEDFATSSFVDEFEKEKKATYSQAKNSYDIDLSAVKDDINVLKKSKEVIAAFHALEKDECKILILLKHVLAISHLEIVSALNPFYMIKNANVSRNKLKRCMQELERLKNEMAVQPPSK